MSYQNLKNYITAEFVQSLKQLWHKRPQRKNLIKFIPTTGS